MTRVIYELDELFGKKTWNQCHIKWYCHKQGLETLTNLTKSKHNWCCGGLAKKFLLKSPLWQLFACTIVLIISTSIHVYVVRCATTYLVFTTHGQKQGKQIKVMLHKIYLKNCKASENQSSWCYSCRKTVHHLLEKGYWKLGSLHANQQIQFIRIRRLHKNRLETTRKRSIKRSIGFNFIEIWAPIAFHSKSMRKDQL